MRIPQPLLSGMGALCLVMASGCGLPGDVLGGEESVPEIRIAMPDWPGGQANAAVAAHVIEEELGINVVKVESSQRAAWTSLGNNGIQAILEDWGALPEERELWVERKRYVEDAGGLGIDGHVGWYVPKEFADAHPEALDPRRLNDFAEQLGGRVLQGDPQFATRDQAIIEDLGLDLRTEAAGSEEALIEEISRACEGGRPVLTYFWEPHWLAAKVDLAEVRLPEVYYPRQELRKYLNADFAAEGGEAADFLRNFSWTAADQNEVAELIAAGGLSPEAAAERWVTEHPDAVAAWLGDNG